MFDFDFNEDSLKGKTIILSGGSGGLGSAVAVLLAKEGANLVIGFRSNSERAQKLKRHLEDQFSSRIELVEGELTGEKTRASFLDASRRLGGPPQGLVCLAGNPARVKFEEVSDADMVKSMEENYIGPVLLARDISSAMIEEGTAGSIVLFSTMQAVAAFDGSINYAGPKTALIQAVRIMAKQWGGKTNIRVNAIAPGVNAAGMALKSISSGKYDFFLEKGIIPRFGKAEDIARTVRFLLEPDNYITGQVITVDGGLTLRRDK